jgi:DNA ligase (NAD+)
MEGFGDKRVANLMTAIEASKTRGPGRLLTALGIQGVGEVVAELLMDHFDSLDTLAGTSLEELNAIPGIGPVLAQSIVNWFAQEPNRRVVEKLRAAGVATARPREEMSSSPKTLAGLTFVITGTLPTLSRETAKELVKAHGGKVTDSVSKNTHYLVAGESAGSKLARAQQLGVPVIDEATLQHLAAGQSAPYETGTQPSLLE